MPKLSEFLQYRWFVPYTKGTLHGVGTSGMGAYHGVEGFRTLSHAKGIYVQGRWNGSALLRAPFGWLTSAILNVMLR